MDLEEYKTRYPDDDAAPGWEAISARLEQVYPGVEPKHYGTVIKHMLGGPDPLDGISIYRCGPADGWHYHYVSYGFSALYYNEEQVGGEFSGFGFELSLRLQPFADDPEWPVWPCNMLQNLARYVFKSGNWFDEHHWIPANGPLRLDTQTALTGALFVTDPVLGRIDTPHGRLQFLQLVGITEAELAAIRAQTLAVPDLVAALARRDPLLVTDLARTAT